MPDVQTRKAGEDARAPLRPTATTPLAAALTYVPGYDHNVALNPVGQTLTGFTSGQTVNLRAKAGNPAGNTYSAVKTVTTL